ncbi:cell wall-binding repeat-containing protein [Candidatus Poriferisodalis sp.]|uniref:cell wall-binding repeat-containing protein n=1 Tax=Candidatus Poriferisodalis sp. TaxID=3101277 RepID=UPI003B01AC04
MLLLPSVSAAQSDGGHRSAADDGGALAAVRVERFGGADRYATSLLVAEAFAALSGGAVEEVVVVSGTQWTDAVVAAPLAGVVSAPVLLVPAGGLRDDLAGFIAGAGVTDAIIISADSPGRGHGVGRAVDEAIRAAGVGVTRVGGGDQYATSVEVARRLGAPGEFGGFGATAIVASGEVFADALVAGPLAARRGLPIVLTPRGELHAAAASYLTDAGIDHVILMGGAAALSTAVQAGIESLGITVDRMAGATRFETAIELGEYAAEHVGGCFDSAMIGLARADVPFDAFSAAPLLSERCAPLVLSGRDAVPASTAAFLDSIRAGGDSATLTVFGGNAAISADAIGSYLGQTTVTAKIQGTSVADGRPDDPPSQGGSEGSEVGGSEGSEVGGSEGSEVGGSEGSEVGGSEGSEVGGSEGSEVGGSEGSEVGGSEGSEVGGSEGSEVGGSEGSEVGGSEGSEVGGSEGSEVGGSEGSEVGGSEGSEVGGSEGSEVGGSEGSEVGGSEGSEVGGSEGSEVNSVSDGVYTAIAAGRGHSCAVSTDGSIDCWGDNEFGQADAPDGVYTAIAAGGGHSCVVSTDGSIDCWGRNDFGQADAPDGVYTAIAVRWHSCAVSTDGSIDCWGRNDFGQADAPDGVYTAIAVGWEHSCAVSTDGSIDCWGDNEFGQADAPDGVYTAIAVGWWHSCAVSTDGSIDCWGDNEFGQADAPDGVYTAIAVGWWHSCAVSTDGSIDCWGDNEFGQADAPDGVYTAIAAGWEHSCAVSTDGSIDCWGDNRFGQADALAGS